MGWFGNFVSAVGRGISSVVEGTVKVVRKAIEVLATKGEAFIGTVKETYAKVKPYLQKLSPYLQAAAQVGAKIHILGLVAFQQRSWHDPLGQQALKLPAVLLGCVACVKSRPEVLGKELCSGLICPDTSIGGQSTIRGVLHDKAAPKIRYQSEAGSRPYD